MEGWKEVEGVFWYRGLPCIPEIIRSEVITRHHDDLLAGHFGIDKIRELISRKYYRPSLRKDVENYVKGYNVCLASKVVRYKPHGDLKSLSVPTHRWKDLSMDYMTGLPLSADWKGDNYDSILVKVNHLTKMVYYEPVKVIIDVPGLAEIIIDVVVRHYGLPNSIMSNWGAIFMFKFWSPLSYFLGIKRRLYTTFHSQTDG